MANFQFFIMVAAAILNFLNFEFLTVKGQEGQTVTKPNFVISQTVAEIWQFFRMAAICNLGFVMRVWTTHEGHLVVFITVQNLAGIHTVIL